MTEQNLNLVDEVKRRRTFAIISHPDAGKTTLTEKFLLYGGAIREAGSVKSRKSQKHAVSDWMEIEKQRGISVASSVLQFEYNNFCINILIKIIFKQRQNVIYITFSYVISCMLSNIVSQILECISIAFS